MLSNPTQSSMMPPMVTAGIASERVAKYVSTIIRDAEGIETEDVEHLAELLVRDINNANHTRYEDALTFSLPLAINPATGSRSSIASYINNVIDSGYPLTTSLHSLASKVLLEECDGKPKAVGVEYIVGEGLYSADGRYDASSTGEVKTVKARKEVIVSGGTFNTPQILKLSGVGPREELEELGIPVVVDLPAVVRTFLPLKTSLTRLQGNFMQDNYEAPVHIRASLPWFAPPNFTCPRTFNDSDPCFPEWQANGTGQYSTSPGTFMLTYRSSRSWDNDTDLFLLSGAGGSSSGFYPGFSNRTAEPHVWGTSIVKMQTGNPAGTVTLQSKDPRQAPKIQFNFFDQRAEEDLQALAEGVELLIRAHDEMGVEYTVVSPNPNVEIKQAIKDETFSHHASSSCRMGPKGDRNSCVDSRFRVNGVESLRVVDASVFPRVPGAMPNGPTFTISRKAFETILEDDNTLE